MKPFSLLDVAKRLRAWWSAMRAHAKSQGAAAGSKMAGAGDAMEDSGALEAEKERARWAEWAIALLDESPGTLVALRERAQRDPGSLRKRFPQETLDLARWSGPSDPMDLVRWARALRNKSPLAVAVFAGNATAVEFLAPVGDMGERIQEDGEPLLSCAIHSGVWKWLIDCADVNAKDIHGKTALMEAVACRAMDAVNALLAKPECNADARDHNGDSALSFAVKAESAEMAKRLIAASGQKNRELAFEAAAQRMRSAGSGTSPHGWACLDLLLSCVNDEMREPAVRWAMAITNTPLAKRLPTQWARMEASILRAEMDGVSGSGIQAGHEEAAARATPENSAEVAPGMGKAGAGERAKASMAETPVDDTTSAEQEKGKQAGSGAKNARRL